MSQGIIHVTHCRETSERPRKKGEAGPRIIRTEKTCPCFSVNACGDPWCGRFEKEAPAVGRLPECTGALTITFGEEEKKEALSAAEKALERWLRLPPTQRDNIVDCLYEILQEKSAADALAALPALSVRAYERKELELLRDLYRGILDLEHRGAWRDLRRELQALRDAGLEEKYLFEGIEAAPTADELAPRYTTGEK